MTRRAMTFLEVVAAVALLAVLTSTIFGAFTFMMGRQRLEQQTLAAHEVANRLVLSYLDDRNAMPDPSLPIEYGPERYRWEYRVDPVKIRAAEPANPDAPPPPAPIGGRVPFHERIRQVTVWVWLSEESGGSFVRDEGVPNARITRPIYPIANRNPDSFDNMIKSDTGIRGYMDEILGGDRAPSGTGARPAAPSGARPAPAGGRPVPATSSRPAPARPKGKS